MRPRILTVSSREICYFSGSFFAARLADAFEALGCEVRRLEFTLKDDLDAVLVPLHGQNFDLILDVNTQMCHLVDDDGPVLDLIGGPFYDYVVDHPLFHYNSLNAPVKNLNAILIDRGQKAYVDRYYPSVKRSLFLPLAATEAENCEKHTKNPERVLVMSSFTPPEKSLDLMDSAPDMLKTIMHGIVEIRMADPLISTDAAFDMVIRREDYEFNEHDRALMLNACYPADHHIRNAFRADCVKELIHAGIPLTLTGEGWEALDGLPFGSDKVRLEKPVTFALSFHHIAKEHILLNNAPMFPDGMHDRVIAGLANRCAVLTDENPYLKENFTDGRDLAFYEGSDLKTLSARAESLLLDPASVFEIEEKGYELYRREHTWKARAKKILEFVLPDYRPEA